jgi:hypothetical protein
MQLITKEIKEKLANNIGNANVDKPWLKLFNPYGIGTWYISEYNEETGEMFGLCDLGFAELGYVNFNDLKDLRCGPFGMPIERDEYWKPTESLAKFADKYKKTVAGH